MHLLTISTTSTTLLITTNSKRYNIVEKKNYSYDEAYGESLKYFQGDELAARVWVNKYAVKDSFGNIYEKSPEDMHWRIANEVARIEAKYPNPLSSEELFGLLDHFKYIVPQGSPMTGIGIGIRPMKKVGWNTNQFHMGPLWPSTMPCSDIVRANRTGTTMTMPAGTS